MNHYMIRVSLVHIIVLFLIFMIVMLFIYRSHIYIYIEESLAAVPDLLCTDVAAILSFLKGFATSISIQKQDSLQKRHRNSTQETCPFATHARLAVAYHTAAVLMASLGSMMR